MSMKPMLFSADLTQAIRDGRKTVARRVIKHIPPTPYSEVEDGKLFMTDRNGDWHPAEKFSRYQPGDILYVPELWRCAGLCDDGRYEVTFWDGETVPVTFQDRGRATRWYKYIGRPQWQSPCHMPREAARLFLRVTDVLVMPLQASFSLLHPLCELQMEGVDIEDDCRACIETKVDSYCVRYRTDQQGECEIMDRLMHKFAALWESTILPVDLARYGWAADPVVWVIRFGQISREAAMG